MFTVQGYIDGVSYAVQVGGDRQDVGCAAGSPAAMSLLLSRAGEQIEMSPVGPIVKGNVNTPEGVLAILTADTEVTDVEGDKVPDLFGPATRGVVH